MHLSIVLPAYNESANIVEVIEELCNTIEKTDLIHQYEIWVIDDHSEDDTFQKVKQFEKPNINALRLSRRSGSHTAIRAGIAQSKGDALLCISADGQDDATGILSEMVEKIKMGAHIVWGIRHDRQNEPFFVKFYATLFYNILFMFVKKENNDIDYARVTFYMIEKRVMKAINSCVELNTSLFGLLIWSGFRQEYVLYERRERLSGESKWNFRSKTKLAMDWIMAFSGLPLRFITYTGITFALTGFVYALFITILALLGQTTAGFAETVILILILGGIQMIMLGVLGEYLWRNLEESRKRPLYFIEDNTEDQN